MMTHDERLAAHRELAKFKEETAARLSKDRKQANLEMPSPIVKDYLAIGRVLRDMWRKEEARVLIWQKEHELNGTDLNPEAARRKPIKITIEQESPLGNLSPNIKPSTYEIEL